VKILRGRSSHVFLSVALAGACGQTQAPASSSTPVSSSKAGGVATSAASNDLARAKEAGDWRFIPEDELARSSLWVSHILIAHRESSDEAPFVRRLWKSAVLADRSREQARQIADGLARELARSPERFAAVASSSSDDSTSRKAGGFLGGVTAGDLTYLPNVLDALLATDMGKPSGVVETRYGFHILMRHPPPPEERLSARRVVIGHDDAAWLRAVSRRNFPARSLQQALEIAGNVVRQARENGARFEKLIDEFSDHLEAEYGGDFGVWSSLEPSPRPSQLVALSKLKLGEISEPLETFEGVVVLQRTEARERPRYAMDSIFKRFNPKAVASDPSSRENAFGQLREVGRKLQAEPARFAELQREHCCDTSIEQWSLGRGPLGASEALDKLKIGQITPEPVEFHGRVALVKRLDPNEVDPPPGPLTRLELPTSPDLHMSAERLNPELIKPWVDQVMREGGLVAQQQLLAADRKIFQATLDKLSKQLTDAPSRVARREALDAALAKLRVTLGLAGYRRYWSAIHQALADYRPGKVRG
jgi:hypothetical protein